jgi:protein-L-isoaspartate O-methyltransferase
VGDAHDVDRWRGATKVYVAFALRELPDAWVDALADGGRIVAPVGNHGSQELTLFHKKADGVLEVRGLGRVVYVPDRAQERVRVSRHHPTT